ncbi:hypothetical protein Micbo1qcDRAFT_237594 [Microdochium bolleyi]|uniref:Alpha/Beta hydrolase protein n=1 Tax=Microdochium bolleyi TaxID=196109 RepID=A0A136IJG5_9PEZI|nr:hypothetical protein Micbo1qcDRAFT_237594 [Microdochium bolleyi]
MSQPPAPDAVPGPGTDPNHGQTPGAPATTRFFGSQVGGESVINYGYTDMPMKLLMWDMRSFLTYVWFLPWIVWPLTPHDSGDFDELAFNRANAWCIFVHIILIFLQLGFIIALPFTLLFPLWIDVLAITLFFLVNWALCLLLNGKTTTMYSDPKYASEEDHPHEQWIFLNGVAVGEAWLTSNINRLALTFRRPIIGVHNRTTGILFDVVECLIQRNFGYATGDVREAYKVVKDKLYNPQYTKVVFILHSQGGIEGGLVLDWLLQELPQDLLAKLEVYTFGNAANHFNNPHLHIRAQEEQQQHCVTLRQHHAESLPLTESPVELKSSSPTTSKLADLGMTSNNKSKNDTDSRKQSTRHAIPASDRVIGHVEHYAHTTDFVALWGVLHFATASMANRQLPRFIGRVFSRTSPRGGHQFCQHYLDGMFPLERDPHGGKNDFLGCADTNEFMESIVEDAVPSPNAATIKPEPARPVEGNPKVDTAAPSATPAPDTDTFDLREDIATSFAMLLPDRTVLLPTADDAEVQFHSGGSFHERYHSLLPSGKPVRVKDLSRLWLYRNGKSPADVPRYAEIGADGVARGRTM